MKLPTFLVCGVQKAGTTSLYWYLRQHPQIWLPKVKELNYFNLKWDRPLSWYAGFFEGCEEERAVGEVSPLYLWDEHTPVRIANTLERPRLVFILRNPIERAYSNYWFNISRAAQDPNETFSQAIRRPDGEWRYLSKGLYFEQLSRYARLFPKEQMLILFTEELRTNYEQVMKEIYAFLDVSTHVAREIEIQNKHNKTRMARNLLVSRIWSYWVRRRERFRKLIPPVIAEWTRNARSDLHRYCFVEKTRPEIIPEDRQYLKAWFRDDVKHLIAFLDKSPPWSHDFDVSR